MSSEDLATTFMMAVCVILGTCWVVSRLVRPLGQPPVVAEMIAGVLLGPSLLGLLAPGVQDALFPPEMASLLFTLSQIGVASTCSSWGWSSIRGCCVAASAPRPRCRSPGSRLRWC